MEAEDARLSAASEKKLTCSCLAAFVGLISEAETSQWIIGEMVRLFQGLSFPPIGRAMVAVGIGRCVGIGILGWGVGVGGFVGTGDGNVVAVGDGCSVGVSVGVGSLACPVGVALA